MKTDNISDKHREINHLLCCLIDQPELKRTVKKEIREDSVIYKLIMSYKGITADVTIKTPANYEIDTLQDRDTQD